MGLATPLDTSNRGYSWTPAQPRGPGRGFRRNQGATDPDLGLRCSGVGAAWRETHEGWQMPWMPCRSRASRLGEVNHTKMSQTLHAWNMMEYSGKNIQNQLRLMVFRAFRACFTRVPTKSRVKTPITSMHTPNCTEKNR